MGKTNLNKLFGTNQQKEHEGTWFCVGTSDNEEPIEFKIVRISTCNEAQTSLMRQKKAIGESSFKRGTVPQSVLQGIQCNVLSEHIIKDWKGVYEIDDNDNKLLLPYNKSNCKKLLKELPDLTQSLFDACNDISNFQDALEAKQEEIKNL